MIRLGYEFSASISHELEKDASSTLKFMTFLGRFICSPCLDIGVYDVLGGYEWGYWEWGSMSFTLAFI